MRRTHYLADGRTLETKRSGDQLCYIGLRPNVGRMIHRDGAARILRADRRDGARRDEVMRRFRATLAVRLGF